LLAVWLVLLLALVFWGQRLPMLWQKVAQQV